MRDFRAAVLCFTLALPVLGQAPDKTCSMTFTPVSNTWADGFRANLAGPASVQGEPDATGVAFGVSTWPIDQPSNVTGSGPSLYSGSSATDLIVAGTCFAPGVYGYSVGGSCQYDNAPPGTTVERPTPFTGSFTVSYATPHFDFVTTQPPVIGMKIVYQLPDNAGPHPSPGLLVSNPSQQITLNPWDGPAGTWSPSLNFGFHTLSYVYCGGILHSIPFYFSPNLNECCPDCAGCFGGPINATNGNMRYQETDPLPGTPGIPFVRTYDSKKATSGVFGTGWTSLFDESITVENETNGSLTVVIGTAEGNLRVFNGTSALTQLWPKQAKPASIRNDGAGGYVFREYGADVEHYFSNGRLAKLRQVSTGRETTITYDGTGLITHVDDSWGAWGWTVTESARPPFGGIVSIAIDNTPIVWTYSYTSTNLTTVAESSIAWRTYTYNGAMTSAVDANGNLIESHTYGLYGGATSSVGQADDVTNVEYSIPTSDPNRFITRVTYASGAQTSMYVSSVAQRPRVDQIDGGCASCGSRNTIFAYDDEGRIIREQDARGYVTERSYDVQSRLTSVTTALVPSGCDPESDSNKCRQLSGLGTVTLAPTTSSNTTSYTYGASGWYDRPDSISTASVLKSGDARTETITYDPGTGEILTRTVGAWTGTVSNPHLEQHVTTIALYDGGEGAVFDPSGAFSSGWLALPQPLGKRKSIDLPRTDVADVTKYVYYPVDNAVPSGWRGQLAASMDAAGLVIRYENYDVFGNAQRIIDANGSVTERSFDHLGRLLTTTLKGVPGCDTNADVLCASDLVTTNVYSPATGSLTSVIDPRGNVTVYEYDARGRVAALSRGASPTTLTERLETTYDPSSGRKSLEKYLGSSGGGWIETRRESYQYDALGQMITQTHADGAAQMYSYDDTGMVTTAQDENHSTPNTNYTYDPVRRLASVRQKLGAGEALTSYSYDRLSNLTRVTDPNGNVTSYSYDDFGRLISQTSPVSGTTAYAYDAGDNLVTVNDAVSTTVTRTYDALGRLTDASYSRPGADAAEVSYAYDADDCGRGNSKGRLSRMTDADGDTLYCYERRGLLTREIGPEFVTSYGYDAAGNRNSLVYPSGRGVSYTFDAVNRPNSVIADGLPIINGATYLPFGPVASLQYGNGTAASRTYDARYRLQTNMLTGPSGPIASYAYAEDAAGNITQIHDTLDATYNRDFGYDDANRLTQANTGTSLWGTGSYQYDAMGNITSLHLGPRSLSFSYDGTTPKIQGLYYDALGNENAVYNPGDGNQTTVYDARNLVRQVGSTRYGGDGGHTYEYDGRGVMGSATSYGFGSLGNRFSWQALTQKYVFSPESRLLSQSNWSQEDLLGVMDGTDHIWLGDLPVGETFADPSQATRFTFTDHLGAPILQTDSSRDVVWRVEYEPYGDVYAFRAADATDPQILRFPGQLASEIGEGLSYNVFRWYRAGWGRYTQADPAGFYGGIHFYAYVADNPLVAADPLGLWKTGKKNSTDNTIVCDGKGNVIPQLVNVGDPETKKCAGDCFLQHELSHKQDADTQSPGVCKGKAAGIAVIGDSPLQTFTSEVKAWNVFVSCIESKMFQDYKSGGCCQATLANLYEWALDNVQTYTIMKGKAK